MDSHKVIFENKCGTASKHLQISEELGKLCKVEKILLEEKHPKLHRSCPAVSTTRLAILKQKHQFQLIE
jgi:hypothetical protein